MPSCFLLTSKSSLRSLAGLLVLFFLSASAAFAAAGKIQFVAGVAKIVNDKKVERPAVKGEALEQGDSIVTGANGSVQVALADGGLLAVRPNTQMRIDAYAYSGKADDSNNKSFFSLAKGTFRSITGTIGHNNKQAYKVTTPTATMGIRGTDHEPAVVLPLPPGQTAQTPLEAAPPGSYDRVNSGQTFIQTPNGLIILKPNQVGFAPAGGGAPVILPNVPAFYSSAPKPGAVIAAAPGAATNAGGNAGSTTGTESTISGSSGSTEVGSFDAGVIFPADISTLNTLTTTVIQTVTTNPITGANTGTSTPVATNTTITTTPSIVTALATASTAPTLFQPPGSAPLGSGAVGAYVNAGGMGNSAGSIYLTAAPPTQDILLGPQYELLAIFDGLSTPTFEFQSFMSALTDQGSYTFVDGARVDWGRWLPGYLVFENGSQTPTTTIGDFHYAVSTDITPLSFLTSGSLTGSYVYNYVGGTSPTDLNGIPGTLNSVALNVDFTMQTVVLNVSTTVSATTLTGFASGSITAFVNPGIGIVGSTGTAPTDTTLKAYGQFVGPTASGAITSYDLRDNSGNGAIGTAVFAR